jgi:hypothetical protein
MKKKPLEGLSITDQMVLRYLHLRKIGCLLPGTAGVWRGGSFLDAELDRRLKADEDKLPVE